jgi:hypothetical protein
MWQTNIRSEKSAVKAFLGIEHGNSVLIDETHWLP